ncbi:MAG: 4-(cytidine 5'-diphospho)-2-C-methyl-D-erythritol kinase [Candidatus Aminicenantes bacterium]|nr:4-(cytidine 5'-diphospho)-2-C-methyl-D-erythritol kinase [Candidatus Aminicenantes bacterium]
MIKKEWPGLKAFSFAKINLGLEVLFRREDGYHEIRTLFQTVNFHDDLEFSLAPVGEISLEGNEPSIAWDETNLVFKAASLLKEKYLPDFGIRIKVNKKIPVGSGLGGGSSNAAVTLLALNYLWNLNLTLPALLELARSLGADVAYFLTGGLCLGEGRGDLISPLRELPPLNCLLFWPEYSISTAMIYNFYDLRAALTKKDQPSRILEFLERRRLRILENELEAIVFEVHPELKKVKEVLLEEEPLLAAVSGTGSALYALFLDKEKAEKALALISRWGKAILTETLPREYYRPLLL